LKESRVARKGAAHPRKQEPPRKKPPTPRPPGQEKAIEEFAAAFKVFQKRDLAKARDLFKELLEKFPRESEILDRVHTYLQICERGLHPVVPRLKDADDFYYQGVFLMNQQNLDEALGMFERALAADPANEKILYSHAAALLLAGRRGESLDSLRRATSASHANRARAANDVDFESFREDPEFQDIVRGERGAGV
jgi:tetratricopeptide (TPR) repeat protein